MTGLDVIELLKKEPATAGVPIVILSAGASEHIAERARAAGAIAVLAKPLDVRQLFQIVGQSTGRPAMAAA
jgi:two-component system chemotaxis response regulator CheY